MDTENHEKQPRRHPDESAAWYRTVWYRRGYAVLVSALILVVLGVDRLQSGEILWGWLEIASGVLLGVVVVVDQRRRDQH
ncbi:hypothetical protein BH23ACT6_BH23ACT6_14410 [soil metagenome]